LKGLGWRSVNGLTPASSIGSTRTLAVRGGYGINQAPIEPATAGLNIASPLVQTQAMHIGGSLAVNRQARLNVAYSYFPQNEVSGPIQPF
jgi:hypothetical protein